MLGCGVCWSCQLPIPRRSTDGQGMCIRAMLRFRLLTCFLGFDLLELDGMLFPINSTLPGPDPSPRHTTTPDPGSLMPTTKVIYYTSNTLQHELTNSDTIQPTYTVVNVPVSPLMMRSNGTSLRVLRLARLLWVFHFMAVLSRKRTVLVNLTTECVPPRPGPHFQSNVFCADRPWNH